MENLFFFWGQEDFLINSEIEKLKEKNIDKNFETMSYKKLYDPDFEDVINAVKSVPMMFGNVMHVIDVNKFFLSSEKTASDKDNTADDWALKQFEEALQNKSPKNIVVLRCVIPLDSKKKVDTRKKIYKITSKYANEKQFPLYRDFDKYLPDIISKIGEKHGLKLSDKTIKVIVEQMGTYLGIINSELQKLAITIYPETSPKVDDIQNICTKKDDVFTILEKIFRGNKDTALFELKKVLEKNSIQEVMGAIQYSLRNLVLIKLYFQKLGKFGVAQKMHIPEFIVEKNYNMLSNVTGTELLNLKNKLLKVEYAMKTGECINPETALEMALMGVNNV